MYDDRNYTYLFYLPGYLPPGLSPQRSGFPGSYMRSRLSVLPEEQGTLLTNQRPGFRSRDLSQPIIGRDSGPQSTPFHHQSGSTLRRKRSQSLADLQMSINGISDEKELQSIERRPTFNLYFSSKRYRRLGSLRFRCQEILQVQV